MMPTGVSGAGVFSWLSLVFCYFAATLRSCGELPAVLRTSLVFNWRPRWSPVAPAERLRVGVATRWRKMLSGYGLLQLLFMLRLMPPVFITTV